MLTSHFIRNKSIPCHHLTRLFFFPIVLWSCFFLASSALHILIIFQCESSIEEWQQRREKFGKKCGPGNIITKQTDNKVTKTKTIAIYTKKKRQELKLNVYACVMERCFWFEFADWTNKRRMNVCSCFSSLRFVCKRFRIHVSLSSIVCMRKHVSKKGRTLVHTY